MILSAPMNISFIVKGRLVSSLHEHMDFSIYVSDGIPTEVPGRPRIPNFVHLSSQPVGTATMIDSENSATSSTMFLRLIHQLVST